MRWMKSFQFPETIGRKQYLWMLAAFAFLLCFGALECVDLASGDETRVAGISAEMFCKGNYAVPRLNGKPFLEYPGLYYYLQCASFKIFGICDFAAKIPSAIAAFASGFLIFFLALRIGFRDSAAFLSSIFLLTGAQFWSNGRTGMVDTVLAFFIFLSIYGFASFLHAERKRMVLLSLYSLGIAGGIMTKGMIGFILPVAVLGCFLVARDILEKRIRLSAYFALGGGLLIGFLPWFLWLFLLYKTEGWDAFYTAFWVNNFGRFLGTQGDHVEPFYYYLIKLPGLFQPWLLILFAALFVALRRIWKEKSKEMLFLCCFLLIPFFLLTVSSSKRQVYLLPLYAPAALLCGIFVSDLFRNERIRKFLTAFSVPFVFLFLLEGIILCFFASGIFIVYPILLILFGGGALCCANRKMLFLCLFLLSFSCSYTGAYATLFERVSRKNSLKPLFSAVVEKEKTGARVFLISPAERTSGAAYFYLRKSLPEKRAEMSDPATQEWWIIRRRRGNFPGNFGDSHFLVTPAEYFAKK